LSESYEPYIGIEWGRKADDEPGFSLSVELGVALLDPQAELQATVALGGIFPDQAALDATLNRPGNSGDSFV